VATPTYAPAESAWPDQKIMEITLTPRHRRIVSGLVKAGAFKTPQAVVAEALRLLEQERKSREKQRREMARSVRDGLRQIKEGCGVVADEDLLNWACAEGRRRVASRRRKASCGRPFSRPRPALISLISGSTFTATGRSLLRIGSRENSSHAASGSPLRRTSGGPHMMIHVH